MRDVPFMLFRIFIGGFILVQLVMGVLYFFVPFFYILLVHSFAAAFMSLAVSAAFVVYAIKLSAVLRLPAGGAGGRETDALVQQQQQQQQQQQVGDARSSMAVSAVPSPGRGVSLTVAETHSKSKRRDKITTIAAICTTCEVFRAGVLIYQARILLERAPECVHAAGPRVMLVRVCVGRIRMRLTAPCGRHRFDSQSWWVVIFLNYFCNEIGATLAVLPILHRGRKPRQATFGSASDLSPAGARAMRRPEAEDR